MGAWENGNFGNDDAMDFVMEANTKESIVEAILKISTAPENEYLESPDCSVALAAIEYIAAALGNPAEDFPEEAVEWVTKHKAELLEIDKKETDIISHSNQAIDKIKTNSELKELWEESEEFEDWLHVVEGLKIRLS